MGVLASNLNGISRAHAGNGRHDPGKCRTGVGQQRPDRRQRADPCQRLPEPGIRHGGDQRRGARAGRLGGTGRRIMRSPRPSSASRGRRPCRRCARPSTPISKSLGGIAGLATRSVEKSVEGSQAVQKVVEAISGSRAGSERIVGHRDCHLGYRRPDQPARPERLHRGGAGRRARARLRGGGGRGEQAG